MVRPHSGRPCTSVGMGASAARSIPTICPHSAFSHRVISITPSPLSVSQYPTGLPTSVAFTELSGKTGIRIAITTARTRRGLKRVICLFTAAEDEEAEGDGKQTLPEFDMKLAFHSGEPCQAQTRNVLTTRDKLGIPNFTKIPAKACKIAKAADRARGRLELELPARLVCRYRREAALSATPEASESRLRPAVR